MVDKIMVGLLTQKSVYKKTRAPELAQHKNQAKSVCKTGMFLSRLKKCSLAKSNRRP